MAKSLTRGKVDFSLYVEITGVETNTKINEGIVKQYMKQLSSIVSSEDTELLKMAIQLPDILKTEREEIEESEFSVIIQTVQKALKDINTYRSDEGGILEKDFITRISTIKKLLKEVIKIDPERIENLKKRLQKAITEIKEKVDQNRFEQELIYYLEKYDITEEKVRLTNHLDYFLEALLSTDSNGKKLGFITQEIGREN